MLEKFKERLKAKSRAAGANLSDARIDVLSDRLSKKFPDLKDEDVDVKIDDLYNADDFKEFAAIDDYQRAKSARDAKPKDKTPEAPKEPDKTDPNADLQRQFRELSDKLAEYEKKEAQKRLKDNLSQKLLEKKIPVLLAKGRNPETEESIELMVTEIEKDYNEMRQGIVNNGMSASSLPLGSTGRTDNIESDIKSWATADKKKE